ncbi:MAG TPA: hypothetical protein V6D19_11265 [Stenomitos sp.]
MTLLLYFWCVFWELYAGRRYKRGRGRAPEFLATAAVMATSGGKCFQPWPVHNQLNRRDGKNAVAVHAESKGADVVEDYDES